MSVIADGATVCGAIANLMRRTNPNTPVFEGISRAYGVALEAAGLVPAVEWTDCAGRDAHAHVHVHVCVSCSPDGSTPGPGCLNCRNTGMDQTPCQAEGHVPHCPRGCCDGTDAT